MDLIPRLAEKYKKSPGSRSKRATQRSLTDGSEEVVEGVVDRVVKGVVVTDPG